MKSCRVSTRLRKEKQNRLCSLKDSWILDYLEDPSERKTFKPSLLYWDEDDKKSGSISMLSAATIGEEVKDWLDFYQLLLSLPKIHINDGIKYFNFPDNVVSDDEEFRLVAYMFSSPKR